MTEASNAFKDMEDAFAQAEAILAQCQNNENDPRYMEANDHAKKCQSVAMFKLKVSQRASEEAATAYDSYHEELTDELKDGGGCIAGPVVVASCCILQPYYDTFLSTSSSSTTQSKSEVLVSQSEMAIPSKDGCKQTSVQPEVQVSQSEMDILSKVNDCKQLTATQRQDIYETIQSHPEIFAISISQRTPEEIDEVNINRAQMLAFAESIETLVEQHELPFDSAYSIVDGQKSPKLYASQRIQSNDGEEGLKVFKCRPYVNADANVYCVALASIIARVVRDEAMQKLDEQYPLYRFSQHSGFGNKEHIEILHKLGAIEGVHRMSFKQVKGR